jgi:hypothetical protein
MMLPTVVFCRALWHVAQIGIPLFVFVFSVATGGFTMIGFEIGNVVVLELRCNLRRFKGGLVAKIISKKVNK